VISRVKKLSIYAAIISPLLLLAWIGIQHVQLKSGFAEIRRGSSSAEITRLLGQPKWVGECGHWGGHPPDGCVKDFGYLSFLLFTDVWVVSLDANDMAVGKYRYRSP
jgi:hypothetical protein